MKSTHNPAKPFNDDDMDVTVMEQWNGIHGEVIRVKFIEPHERTENKRIMVYEVENSPLATQEDSFMYMAIEIPDGVTYGDVAPSLLPHLKLAYSRTLKEKGFEETEEEEERPRKSFPLELDKSDEV